MRCSLDPSLIAPWLAREDISLGDLVGAADELLRTVAPTQKRYKVQARPDVRTIRYYQSQGLLPKPVGYARGRAQYGGTHLIRLLLVKKLQADHLPLRKIKALLQEATDEQVLEALADEGAPTAPKRALKPIPRHRFAAPPASPAVTVPTVCPTTMLQLDLARDGVSLGRLEVSPASLKDPALRRALAARLGEVRTWLLGAADEGDVR